MIPLNSMNNTTGSWYPTRMWVTNTFYKAATSAHATMIVYQIICPLHLKTFLLFNFWCQLTQDSVSTTPKTFHGQQLASLYVIPQMTPQGKLTCNVLCRFMFTTSIHLNPLQRDFCPRLVLLHSLPKPNRAYSAFLTRTKGFSSGFPYILA